LLKKGIGNIGSEEQTESPLTSEQEAEALELLLPRLCESSFSRLLSVTSARDVSVELDAGEHATAALALPR